MDYCARVKRKRDHANRRNIHIQQIPHLKDRFCPLEEYDEEYVFGFLDKGLSTLYKERPAVNFDAANSN